MFYDNAIIRVISTHLHPTEKGTLVQIVTLRPLKPANNWVDLDLELSTNDTGYWVRDEPLLGMGVGIRSLNHGGDDLVPDLQHHHPSMSRDQNEYHAKVGMPRLPRRGESLPKSAPTERDSL